MFDHDLHLGVSIIFARVDGGPFPLRLFEVNRRVEGIVRSIGRNLKITDAATAQLACTLVLWLASEN
jgi:hypothetical protein